MPRFSTCNAASNTDAASLSSSEALFRLREADVSCLYEFRTRSTGETFWDSLAGILVPQEAIEIIARAMASIPNDSDWCKHQPTQVYYTLAGRSAYSLDGTKTLRPHSQNSDCYYRCVHLSNICCGVWPCWRK